MKVANAGSKRELQLMSTGNDVRFIAEGQEVWKSMYDDIQNLAGTGVIWDAQWLIGSRFQMRPELDRAGVANTSLGTVFADAALKGTEVLVLAWRNWDGSGRMEEEEDMLAEIRATQATIHAQGQVNRAEAYLDGRVNPLGSLHQKALVIGLPDGTVTYIGGLDFCESRWDIFGSNTTYPVAKTPEGRAWQSKAAALRLAEGGGDPLQASLTHGWHDTEVRIDGPAGWDIALNFAQRWNEQSCYLTDAYPVRQPPLTPIPLPRKTSFGQRRGTQAVQILRTFGCQYAVSSGCYKSFAPKGEGSILAGLVKAIKTARHFIYIEDQYYFFIQDVYDALRSALRGQVGHLFVCVQYPEQETGFSTMLFKAWHPLYQEFPGRVHFYYRKGGIYIHSKTKIIDDVYAMTGSSNMNYRSNTGDAEMSASIVDEELITSADGYTVSKAQHEFRTKLWEDNTGISQEFWKRTKIEDAAAIWDTEAAKPNAKIGAFKWSWNASSSDNNIPEYQTWADNSAFFNKIDPDERC